MAHRILICVALVLLAAAPARAQAPRTSPYVNGPVAALLADGDTLYVGGSFSAAGTAAGPFVLASPDGRIVRTHPGFSGLEVRAVAPDGAGGWYVGGTFDRVDGRERHGLVHLLADGTVDPDFLPDPGPVTALARLGGTLWVGGERLLAVDAATGERLPGGTDGPVHDLAVAGERLIVAGPSGLTALGAWEVAGEVVDVDVRDGVVYAAGPAGAVARRASDGDEIVRYAADEPHAIAAGDGVVVIRGRRLAAFDAATGIDRGWFGDGDGGAADDAGAADDGDAADGGRAADDTARGGTGAAAERAPSAATARPADAASERRPNAAAAGPTGAAAERPARGEREACGGTCVSPASPPAAAATHVPRAADAGGALAIAGTRLYVAGDGFAAYDLRDGTRVPWSPPLLGGTVHALAAADGVVAIGGTQSAEDGVARPNLAAFDLRTGAVKAFAPQVDGAISALLEVGGMLYAGGAGGLAAFDPQTGAAQPFAVASAPVHALAAAGDALFVGGAPGTLGGVPTDGLGAVSLTTGAALPFAPTLGSCTVDALAVSGATLHVGGCFGLRSFRELAPIPGPAVNGRVHTLLADAWGGLWAGGAFAGGNVAHFAADGTPQHDSPVTDGPVHALAIDDGNVHLGGRFTRIQDAPRLNVGRVALIGGSAGAFNPRPAGTVHALAPLPGQGLAVGGAFGSTWDATTGGLAVFGDPPPSKVRPPVRATRPKPRVSAPRGSPSPAVRR